MKEKIEEISDFFQYTIWRNITDFYYNLKWFFKNLKTFREVMWQWRPWDYRYQVDLFKFGIGQLLEDVFNGPEEEVSRDKKISAMEKLILELNRDVEEEVYERFFPTQNPIVFEKREDGTTYIPNASDEYKEKMASFRTTLKTERKQHLMNIFEIINGQDPDYIHEEVEKLKQTLSDEEKKELEKDGYYKLYTQVFDGTGIEGWWS